MAIRPESAQAGFLPENEENFHSKKKRSYTLPKIMAGMSRYDRSRRGAG
jgi:hypothetical protein